MMYLQSQTIFIEVKTCIFTNRKGISQASPLQRFHIGQLYTHDIATYDTGSCSYKDARVEIDMRAPFESVKEVAILFAERAVGDKITKKRTEIQEEKSRISNETQLHLLQKALVKLREQLKNIETTKSQAQVEVAEDNKVVEDLSWKLEKATESREKACKDLKLLGSMDNTCRLKYRES